MGELVGVILDLLFGALWHSITGRGKTAAKAVDGSGEAPIAVTPPPPTDEMTSATAADVWEEYRRKQDALDVMPGEGSPEPRVVALQPATALSNKSPFLAAALSFLFFGGTGQIYLGQWKKGVVLILGMIFLNFFLLAGMLIAIVAVGDAYGTAKKMRAGSLVGEWEFNINWKAAGAAVLLYFLALYGLVELVCLQGC